MNVEKPLVNKDCILQTSGGKGSWTWVELPEITMPKTAFGMLKVKGSIDDYTFSNVHLMPIGNGHLGLAIKSEIRKRIKKQAPDSVHITLYVDQSVLIIPEDLLLCMECEDGILEKFGTYSDGQKKAFVDWINAAKSEQTKVDRIARTITMVQKGEKFY